MVERAPRRQIAVHRIAASARRWEQPAAAEGARRPRESRASAAASSRAPRHRKLEKRKAPRRRTWASRTLRRRCASSTRFRATASSALPGTAPSSCTSSSVKKERDAGASHPPTSIQRYPGVSETRSSAWLMAMESVSSPPRRSRNGASESSLLPLPVATVAAREGPPTRDARAGRCGGRPRPAMTCPMFKRASGARTRS
mmetsp:Transcript_8840/g.24305  ORF Transcript_8840/g.24305 Transcript_8840/m.24305 type:complete len:200 (+) Transcript_8840:408-1007(+)